MTERNPARVEREARLRWVPVDKMKVNPLAQRECKQSRVDHLVSIFDPEKIGAPTVNERDGSFYVVDGQHRIEAFKLWMGDWAGQQLQCWVYVGLSEEQEADIFLSLNDYLAIHAFDKFRNAVKAGRDMESDIDRVIRSLGLVVTRDDLPGGVGAVGTLIRIYKRSGPSVLARSCAIARDSYGDAGLVAPVLDGLGLVCDRYNGELDMATAVERLGNANGGVNGLLGKAEVLRRQTGNYKSHCVAAAAVEFINSGKGGKKLPSWWKS